MGTFGVSRALALGATVFAACVPAWAINEMFAKNAPVAHMNEEDFRIAREVIRKALDEGKPGQAYEWKNPATSASGSVTPTKSFERQGLACRSARFTIIAGGYTQRSAWNLCKTPEGWKVAE